MTEHAGLEQGYRRLLAWYPAAFRRDHEDEILAVLMAGARRGQRRPGLLEGADLIRSAAVLRLRRIVSGSAGEPWGDALALFSVVAPLMLLVASLLEVALPYRLPWSSGRPGFARPFGLPLQIGGLGLLSSQGFDIALGCQVLIAVLVLLGLRWLALAAIAGSAACWVYGLYQVPDLLQLLSGSVFLLTAAALLVSPGPRRGRQLLTWRRSVIALLAVAAVQATTLRYDGSGHRFWFAPHRPPDTLAYLVAGLVLALAAVGLSVTEKTNRYFLLFLAVMGYPYVLQVAVPASSSGSDLIGHPTPGHLALLFLLPLAAALAALIHAGLRRWAPARPEEIT